MASLMRFEPQPGPVDTLRRALRAPSALTGSIPALDMYETPETVVVKADVAGVDPKDLEITVLGDTLRIKGEVKVEKESKHKDYLFRERSYGAFVRVVTLPDNVSSDNATAEFENGTLTLTLPKVEGSKAKTISVRTK
ncbi:MAG: Hsp20/alpha crystallin family protein [Chloroflexota bacterium]